MGSKIKQWLAAPKFDDEYQNRVATLLNVILLIFFGFGILINILLPIMNPGGEFLTSLALLVVIGGLLVAMRQGSYLAVQVSSIVFLIAVWVLVTLNSWMDGGMRNMATTLYFVLIVVAGLLLGGNAVIAFGALSVGAAFALFYAESTGRIMFAPSAIAFSDWFKLGLILATTTILARFAINGLIQALNRARANEQVVTERADEITRAAEEAQRLNEQLQTEILERQQAEAALQTQLETIESQQQALRELSSPVIPVMEGIIVLPLVGGIDSQRAQDIMRSVLVGISEHRAAYVILDVTGVPLMDTGIVNHLNKTIQAVQLKGARTIITGISDAVAEAIVDLGIDWGAVETLADLQTGLLVALKRTGITFQKQGTR
jgi:anti-anti-sigma regulatory factor